MSHIQRPLTMPKHPDLLHDLNEMQIAIKLFYICEQTPQVKTAQKSHTQPTWPDILDLLQSAYHAINEQREDPRKY